MTLPFGPGGTGDGEPLDALLGRVRSGSGGPPGPAAPGIHDACGETPEELALRRLMHRAVQDVAPRPDALERLRQAVPARRARRRQALVGAAAGALLIGAAMPSLVHAADSATADSSVAAGASPSPGGAFGPSAQGGAEQGGGASGPAGLAEARRHRGGDPASPAPSAGPTSAPAAGPAETAAAVPACSRVQLGDATAQLDAPDASGRVYGTFQVANVSSSSCTVTGEGRIAVTGQGGADPAAIEVVDHTAGDPAGGLPDPATAPAEVVLAPGKTYQVRFAWVPASSAGTGCAPAGTAGPVGTATGGTAAGSGTGGSGSGPVSTAAPTGTAAPSAAPLPTGITLTHIPQAGDPGAASVTISGACAGTVYRTAALPS